MIAWEHIFIKCEVDGNIKISSIGENIWKNTVEKSQKMTGETPEGTLGQKETKRRQTES